MSIGAPPTAVTPATAAVHLRMPREMDSRVRGNDGNKDKTAKVAQQFEALFVAQMLKSAHAAALAEDPLAGDPTFRDFQDEARAQALAAAAPLGVARLLANAR